MQVDSIKWIQPYADTTKNCDKDKQKNKKTTTTQATSTYENKVKCIVPHNTLLMIHNFPHYCYSIQKAGWVGSSLAQSEE